MPTPTQDDINEFCSRAKNGDIKGVTDYLDRFGAENIIEGRDNGKDTALAWAAWMGQKDMVAFLLDRGAGIDKPGMKERTPLGWAANGGRREVVQLLLERGADSELRDIDGMSPADLATNSNSGLADYIRENGNAMRIAKAEAAAKKKAEEEGQALMRQRQEALKKIKPPKLRF